MRKKPAKVSVIRKRKEQTVETPFKELECKQCGRSVIDDPLLQLLHIAQYHSPVLISKLIQGSPKLAMFAKQFGFNVAKSIKGGK